MVTCSEAYTPLGGGSRGVRIDAVNGRVDSGLVITMLMSDIVPPVLKHTRRKGKRSCSVGSQPERHRPLPRDPAVHPKQV